MSKLTSMTSAAMLADMLEDDSALDEFIEEDIPKSTSPHHGDKLRLPTVVIAGVTVFPGLVLHMDLTDESMLTAVKTAYDSDRLLFIPLQKKSSKSWPNKSNFYALGTIVKVMEVITTSDELPCVVVKGICRGSLIDIVEKDPYIVSEVVAVRVDDTEVDNESRAFMRVVRVTFEEYSHSISNVPAAIRLQVYMCKNPDELSDCIGAYAIGDYDLKVKLLQLTNPITRLERVLIYLRNELEIIETEKEILEKTAENIDRSQRNYFIRTQIQALEAELEDDFDEMFECDEYEEKIRALKVDNKVKEPLLKECERLGKLPEASQEAFVIRTYLDTC